MKGVVSILPELHEEEDQEELDAEFRGFFRAFFVPGLFLYLTFFKTKLAVFR